MAISGAFFNINGCTAFSVFFKGNSYVLSAKHCFPSPTSEFVFLYNDCADVALVPRNYLPRASYISLNLTDSIVVAVIGDSLFSVGYTKMLPDSTRLWTGSVSAVYTNSTLPECPFDVVITGAGDQLAGASGSPVFNGCGLVGIATESMLENMGDFYVKNGAGIVPIVHILALLNSPLAANFTIPSSLVKTVIAIPKKSYCDFEREKAS